MEPRLVAIGDQPELWAALLERVAPHRAGLTLEPIGGVDQVTQPLLVPAKAAATRGPQGVLVTIGTADLFKQVSITSFESTLKLLTSALAPLGSRVVITTLIDHAKGPIAPAVETFFRMNITVFARRIEEMNDRLGLIARRSRFRLVDLCAKTRPTLAQHPAWFQKDGLHLSPEGVAALADELAPTVIEATAP